MALDPIFPGIAAGGKAIPDNAIAFSRHVSSLELHRIEIIVRKQRRNRSNQQNRYYWGVVVALFKEYCGYDDPDEMHDALRMKLLTAHQDGPLPTVRSSAGLTTVEFEDYMLRCRKLAAEMGFQIPEPNEVSFDEY